MNSTKKISSGASLRAALLAGCVLVGALAGVAKAQPTFPGGNWDFVLTGAEQGVGFLEFSGDGTNGTLQGWEVVTHRQAPFSAPSSSDTRGAGIGTGRGTTPGFTNTTYFFLGYLRLTGAWTFTAGGRLVGSITQDDTNFPGGFSFTGITRAGRSIVLNATESPDPNQVGHNVRHVVWNGVPLAAVPLGVSSTPQVDLSGMWLAQGSVTSTTNSQSTQFSTELLTLKSLTGGDPTGFFTDLASSPFAAQSYVITGTGPGYTNFGLALQSSKRRLSLFLREGDFTSANTILRAVEGPLNTNKFISNPMGGTDDNGSIVRYRLQRTD